MGMNVFVVVRRQDRRVKKKKEISLCCPKLFFVFNTFMDVRKTKTHGGKEEEEAGAEKTRCFSFPFSSKHTDVYTKTF